MRVERRFTIFLFFLMLLDVTVTKAVGQGRIESRPGDLIIRYQGKTLGPIVGGLHCTKPNQGGKRRQ